MTQHDRAHRLHEEQGGVPPNVFRLVVDASGSVTAERHDQYPGPPSVTTRTGTCSTDQFARLAAVLGPIAHGSMRGPVPDSPNEWFELTENDERRALSIVSLMTATGARERELLAEIRDALSAIVSTVGEP